MRVLLEAIGLNRAEAMFRSGNYLEPPRLPARLGTEASVIVEQLGEGVEGFDVGEAVNVIPAFSVNPKTFTLDQIVEAHRYLESNQQFGKIVVTVPR